MDERTIRLPECPRGAAEQVPAKRGTLGRGPARGSRTARVCICRTRGIPSGPAVRPQASAHRPIAASTFVSLAPHVIDTRSDQSPRVMTMMTRARASLKCGPAPRGGRPGPHPRLPSVPRSRPTAPTPRHRTTPADCGPFPWLAFNDADDRSAACPCTPSHPSSCVALIAAVRMFPRPRTGRCFADSKLAHLSGGRIPGLPRHQSVPPPHLGAGTVPAPWFSLPHR